MKTSLSAIVLVTAAAFAATFPAAALAQAEKQVQLKQVEADTKMANQEELVGKPAKDFTLIDTQGKEHTLSSYVNEGKIVVLEWFNPQCPIVVRHYERTPTMKKLAEKYAKEDVVWLAVNSGADSTGSAELNEKYRQDWQMSYPVLLDASGDVGRAYGSRNTPAMYVIGKDGVVAYTGGIDNDPRGREDSPTNYVEAAVDALLLGSTVEVGHARPYGCSVKYGR